jgi:hypothetical protein
MGIFTRVCVVHPPWNWVTVTRICKNKHCVNTITWHCVHPHCNLHDSDADLRHDIKTQCRRTPQMTTNCNNNDARGLSHTPSFDKHDFEAPFSSTKSGLVRSVLARDSTGPREQTAPRMQRLRGEIKHPERPPKNPQPPKTSGIDPRRAPDRWMCVGEGHYNRPRRWGITHGVPPGAMTISSKSVRCGVASCIPSTE